MDRHARVLIAGSALALLASACGSAAPATSDPDSAAATATSDASDPATDPTGGATADGGTDTADGGTDTVAIDDFRYAPETITVPTGTSVTWTNEDATAHTVTAGTPDAPETSTFDEDVDEQGQTVSVTFDTPGTYAYFCELHPFMTGTVEVTA